MLGNFNGSVSGGTDAAAITYGSFTGALSAANDAELFSVGNATGSVTAGNDASLTSYGAMNLTVSAGHDITEIWSVGDLSGSFTAVNNIGGGAFSFGSINGSFTATGSTSDPLSGLIGSTSAVGSIGGSFSGLNSVGDLTAGGAITASVSSAVVGGLFDFDAALAATSAPTPPANPAGDILTALASAQAMMTSQVWDYTTSTTTAHNDAVTDLATQQSDATNAYSTALSDALNDLATSNSDLRTEATNDFVTSQTAANDAVTAALTQAATAWTELQASVATQEAAAIAARDAAIQNANDALLALAAGIVQANTDLTNAFNSVSSTQFQQFTSANAQITSYPWDTFVMMTNWFVDQAQAAAQTVADVLDWVPHCGAQAVAKFITLANIGIDFLQGQYDQAVPALAMELLFAGLFRSHFCFTPETPLHLEAIIGEDGVTQFAVTLPLPDDDGNYSWLAVVVVGISATVWLKRREERDRKRLAMSRDIDTLFGASRFSELCEDLNS